MDRRISVHDPRGYPPSVTSVFMDQMQKWFAEHLSAVRGFVERGFDTKSKLIEWCAENARLTAREYWDNQWTQTLIRPLADAGVEPHATHLKAPPDTLIPMFRQQDIHVVVAGGETVGAWKMIAGSCRGNTISIDAWR